jgi:pimeloyl-ACP methyl ester carboxylesterase
MADVPDPRFLDVLGERVRYYVRGEGEPLLMIHGIGAPLEFWRPLDTQLDGVMTISVDPPGSGLSSVPHRYFRMREFAAVFEQVLSRLGLDHVDVMGFSLGGMMAQEFARRSPERVRKLVLASTACGVGAIPAPPMRLASMLSPLRFYWSDHYEKMAHVFHGDGDSGLLHEHMEIRKRIPTSVCADSHESHQQADTLPSARGFVGVQLQRQECGPQGDRSHRDARQPGRDGSLSSTDEQERHDAVGQRQQQRRTRPAPQFGERPTDPHMARAHDSRQ